MINRLLRQATVRPDNIRSMEDRFTIYSGHDNTLSPLLLALGLQLDHWPPFASRYSSYYYIMYPIVLCPGSILGGVSDAHYQTRLPSSEGRGVKTLPDLVSQPLKMCTALGDSK